MQFDPQHLNHTNKEAWDQLYASTPNLVWGTGAVGFLEDFLRPEIARGRSFHHVLDAATGEGRNLPFLLQFADRLTACDASEAALAKVPVEIKPRVRLTRCDLAETPFADASFDFILLCDTVETLPDAAPVLREMQRILAPGGALVCNIPGPEGDVAGIDMTEIGREEYLYRGRYFYRFFRDHEISSLFAETGWQTVRAETMTWTEPAHPGFRAESHRHCSRVFLLTAAS
ncbi:MAG TPA: class I SAM-dependent methyltransferase [Opitutus sp.]|nr:class I SAM-dependent methyltransferase [Opitutus sp.]